MNLCYISLGSNQKCPQRQLRTAINDIKAIPSTSIRSVSNFYWTKAWGLQVQQDFCNAMVEISTTLSPLLLLKYCQRIEDSHGRVRRKRWGPRTLDIDIILYGNRVIKTTELTIPHPHMLTRDFVLTPLLEINPNIQLPALTLIK